jgi:hypothetical protein
MIFIGVISVLPTGSLPTHPVLSDIISFAQYGNAVVMLAVLGQAPTFVAIVFMILALSMWRKKATRCKIKFLYARSIFFTNSIF